MILDLNDLPRLHRWRRSLAGKKLAAVSGHFAPTHLGHLECLEEARELCAVLVAVVNTDYQVALKASAPFMPEGDRLRLVAALRCVDAACLAIDTDRSVSRTLEVLRPDVFANGGDVTPETLREAEVCTRLGIATAFNVGGGKTRSSSRLIEDACLWLRGRGRAG